MFSDAISQNPDLLHDSLALMSKFTIDGFAIPSRIANTLQTTNYPDLWEMGLSHLCVPYCCDSDMLGNVKRICSEGHLVATFLHQYPIPVQYVLHKYMHTFHRHRLCGIDHWEAWHMAGLEPYVIPSKELLDQFLRLYEDLPLLVGQPVVQFFTTKLPFFACKALGL